MLREIKDLYVTVQRRAMGPKGRGIDDMENDPLIFHNFILMIIKKITELNTRFQFIAICSFGRLGKRKLLIVSG